MIGTLRLIVTRDVGVDANGADDADNAPKITAVHRQSSWKMARSGDLYLAWEMHL
jgi:hypothetical protein